MRNHWIGRVGALLALVVVAAGCTLGTGTHWRKAQTDKQFAIFVWIPAVSIDPAIGNDNRTSATFNAAVADAVATWNAHPDIAVGMASEPCESHNLDPGARNCISAYRVTQPFMDSIYPGFPPGTAIGSSQWWQNEEHIFNSGADPNRFTWTRFVISVEIEDEPAILDNTACHELGHDLGLNHANPYDSDGDGTPDTQPQGPCVNGTPDQSPNYNSASGTGTAGYDVDNIEIEYDTCASDGPVGSTPGAANSDGDDPCGAAAQTFGLQTSEPPTLHTEVDTRSDVTG
jgi:hypothetical protein